MSSSGLKTTNFKFMTKDNKQQKLSDSTNTAIAYSTCYKPFFERQIFDYAFRKKYVDKEAHAKLTLWFQLPDGTKYFKFLGI